jgi:short subunit dehydrogenase-like uncharacterized protein
MNALLYGATGYTGRLVTRMAAGYGIAPILAGRNAAAVAALAGEHGLEHRPFALDDPDAVAAGLAGVSVVLHCAGPFIHTYRAMADACIAAGVHYLDITGEIDVFEGLARLDSRAREAGVMLLPGVGFDVVPTDCLAAMLAQRLPGATRLALAISGSGPLSHGTATTALENQHRGGMIRRHGSLRAVPAAWRTRTVDFGDGRPRTAVTIPWGDVSTAYHSTGIGDIEVYAAVPRRMVRVIRATRHFGWLLRSGPVRALQKRLLRARPAGPDAEELERGESRVWGRVEDEAGGSATAALLGPNGYLLTAHAALLVLQRALGGTVTPGFQTPSSAYGARLVLDVPGVSMVLPVETTGNREASR